jgi:isoleucyl-tRNA synthetase
MLAPLVSFTADEAWEFLPGKPAGSIHEALWQPEPFERPESECALWKTLFSWRELALPALERARQVKEIGKALEAKLTFSGPATIIEPVQSQTEALRELLNVSQLSIMPAQTEALTVQVTKAQGQKCERCWHWETDVGATTEHPTLCGRCVKAITS